MKTKLEHTAGPWKADEFGVITGGEGFCTSIAETYQERILDRFVGHGSGYDKLRERLLAESEGNAVLIEAAPEMIEALTICRDALDNTMRLCGCGKCGTCEAYIKAQAVIEKATTSN